MKILIRTESLCMAFVSVWNSFRCGIRFGRLLILSERLCVVIVFSVVIIRSWHSFQSSIDSSWVCVWSSLRSWISFSDSYFCRNTAERLFCKESSAWSNELTHTNSVLLLGQQNTLSNLHRLEGSIFYPTMLLRSISSLIQHLHNCRNLLSR